MNTITFSRYAALFTYGLVTFFIYSILSSTASIQTLWLGWSNLLEKVFNTSDLTSSYSYDIFLFLGGVAIHKIADSFSIYDSKRYWQFNWRYPSLMLSVTFTVSIWVFTELKNNSSYLEQDYILIFLPLLIGLVFLPLLSCLTRLTTRITTFITKDAKQTPQIHSSVEFIADKVLSALEQEQNKSVRISLCGPFGVGKTTAINSAVEKLSNKNNQPKLVHCNIELWGVESESIIQYVLDEILLALGKEIDMCRFRSLPSNYISAMNAGTTSSKILAAFIHKPTSPDLVLSSLSDVLSASNLRLLVTLQDLDRNKNAVESLDALAGLLDRLEGVKGIDYIFAGENTPQFSDTLLRICPLRFDLPKPNLKRDVIELIEALIDEDLKGYYEDIQAPHFDINQFSLLIDLLLPSFRDFQSLQNQIESSWGSLKGEVLLYDLLLIHALKSSRPKLYDVLYQIFQGNISTKDLRFNTFIDDYFSGCTPLMKTIVENTLIHFGLITYFTFPDDKRESLGRPLSLDNITEHHLSIKNERIKNILFSGFLDENNPKQLKIHKTLQKVVTGELSALNDLCNAFKSSDERKLWSNSLNNYGWAMLHNQIEDIDIAQSLIKTAIALNPIESASSLLEGMKVRQSIKMNFKSGLRNYLFSEAAIVDIVELRSQFNDVTFCQVCDIYMSFSYIHRFHRDEPAEVDKYLSLLITRFINSDPLVKVTLLMFCLNVSKDTLRRLDKAALARLLEMLNTLELKDSLDEYLKAIRIRFNYNLNKQEIDEAFYENKKEAIALVEQMLALK
ncbi:P-loop NTPase fold protein [Pseudoalteromonas phenolica]|uniref:P-loop NTPase fold protein n=1 Tax=Pseudoalteromonas phenolica TaxID=161398 RepID=UPI0038505D80